MPRPKIVAYVYPGNTLTAHSQGSIERRLSAALRGHGNGPHADGYLAHSFAVWTKDRSAVYHVTVCGDGTLAVYSVPGDPTDQPMRGTAYPTREHALFCALAAIGRVRSGTDPVSDEFAAIVDGLAQAVRDEMEE